MAAAASRRTWSTALSPSGHPSPLAADDAASAIDSSARRPAQRTVTCPARAVASATVALVTATVIVSTPVQPR